MYNWSFLSSQLIKSPHKNNEGLDNDLCEVLKIPECLTHPPIVSVPAIARCQLSVLYVDPNRENSIKILLSTLFGICCLPDLDKISGSPTLESKQLVPIILAPKPSSYQSISIRETHPHHHKISQPKIFRLIFHLWRPTKYY